MYPTKQFNNNATVNNKLDSSSANRPDGEDTRYCNDRSLRTVAPTHARSVDELLARVPVGALVYDFIIDLACSPQNTVFHVYGISGEWAKVNSVISFGTFLVTG